MKEILFTERFFQFMRNVFTMQIESKELYVYNFKGNDLQFIPMDNIERLKDELRTLKMTAGQPLIKEIEALKILIEEVDNLTYQINEMAEDQAPAKCYTYSYDNLRFSELHAAKNAKFACKLSHNYWAVVIFLRQVYQFLEIITQESTKKSTLKTKFPTGYNTKKNPPQLEKTRKALILNNFIDKSTSSKSFLAAFSGKKISNNYIPIVWIGGITQLLHFIEKIAPDSIKTNQRWVTLNAIFDEKKPGQKFNPNILKNTNQNMKITKKIEGQDILDEILKD